MRFTVLASGSSGNASLLQAADFGLLLDVGLGPRQLSERLASIGASWRSIQAVLLTHTHSDHWRDRTLAQLLRLRIPVYCHAAHFAALQSYSQAFAQMQEAALVRTYEAHQKLVLGPGLQCQPFPVRHDGGPTFGFRFEGGGDLFSARGAIAYAADLGCWDEAIADMLAGVELLALEFNHDVHLERSSGRPAQLIARVLGDDGHLSNEQASRLLHEVLRRSPPGRLRHLVQLHLSRHCNRPSLATAAAKAVLSNGHASVLVHTARQDQALPTLHLA